MVAYFISSQINGASSLNGLSASYTDIGMTIGAIGLICAALAVLRKLANNSDGAKKALISWFIALAVYIAVWNMV
ncbi:MAG: hypothetical protein LBG80_04605 [Bacteroidales bacterium]|jgi:hypothetical protein|nr:hypothetical protein [Bacteroidales bacterium]